MVSSIGLLLEIFITFFKIGLVSFGGGYAMIPIIQGEVEGHRWMEMSQFTDIIAVSAMAPGPIAANSATIVGYKLSYIPGAVAACIGVTLPSLLLILLIGKLFIKYREHPYVKAAFSTLRPTIIGVIAFAAVKFALGNGLFDGDVLTALENIMLMLAAFIVLIKTRLHPAYLIGLSGILGILLF